MTTYDSIPYPSYAYPQTAPAQIGAVAKLFGMQPGDIATAKVLEIGCASGGNILPLAARYSDASFVGVDLSANQIAVAEEHAKAMKLENIKFFAASITDHDFGDEKFDYIIVHGIYSWVPEEVQKRILEICGAHLSDAGVAYVSYNTLPGWNAVKTVRDMMLYHSGGFENPAQKVVEARNMLKFVSDNMQAQSGPYKETLEAEIRTLQNADNNYLFHDHLENVNEPCYFHEFASRAAENGLSYVGDTELQSMFLGNQNAKVVETLGQINDTIRLEQYLDFVNNRRFRMSVLTKSTNELNRKLSVESLEGLAVYSTFLPAEAIDLEKQGETNTIELVSTKNKDVKATITGKTYCVGFTEMMKALPNRLSFEDLVEKTAAVLESVSKDQVKAELGGFILQSIFKGMMNVSLDSAAPCQTASEKPNVYVASRVLGQKGTKVPNLHHEVIALENDQRLIMQYVNGLNSIEQIAAAVKTHVEKGELNVAQNGETVKVDNENIDEILKNYVLNLLSRFQRLGLLVA